RNRPAVWRKAATERKEHKLDIHVDQNDPAVMRLALANFRNANELYAGCVLANRLSPDPATSGLLLRLAGATRGATCLSTMSRIWPRVHPGALDTIIGTPPRCRGNGHRPGEAESTDASRAARSRA